MSFLVCVNSIGTFYSYKRVYIKYHKKIDQDILIYLFPRWLSGKESPCQLRRCRFDP